MTSWIVVTDFDGTLTEKDIGNELCKVFVPDLFKRLNGDYNAGKINLRNYQQELWTGFPSTQSMFKEAALRLASLRPGVNEFLEMCAHKEIPVYIASCGMDLYIETIVERFFSKFAQAAIKGISANKINFDEEKLIKVIAPDSDLSTPEPLHKGRWAQKLAQEHNAKVIAIGNGGSDRTFIAHVDQIFAIEKLPGICEKANQSFIPFENFFDIIKKMPA